MNERLRIALGVILIIAGILYKPGMLDHIIDNKPDKLVKPDAATLVLVEGLEATVTGKEDASRLAGYFEGLAVDFSEIPNITNNLQIQYLLDFTGKKVFGTSLMENGKSKYPLFAPTLSKTLSRVIGAQNSKEPLTEQEKIDMAKLCHAVAWKLYNKEFDREFEIFKNRAKRAILEYSDKNGPAPKPPDPVVTECGCSGTGDVVQGDGHKTPCICSGGEHKCGHNSKCRFIDNKPRPTPIDSGCPCESATTMCVCESYYGACNCESGGQAKACEVR